MTEYIVVFNEEKVQGFLEKDDMDGAIFHLEWGEDYKVYKTSNVLAEIKNSQLNSSYKQALIKKLSKDDDFEMKLSDELDEVLSEMDDEVDF